MTPTADRTGTALWTDELGEAVAAITDADACRRTYALSSTASRRDALPASPRTVVEADDRPTLRSGHDLLDALYALAQLEARENSVDSITDGAFNDGAPLACPTGGCFETGRLWKYVWTRDISYAVDLGLAGVDPLRARNSLEFKLSGRRDGVAGEQIVQDTGTGGSYPVSTDRVVWAMGAAALLPRLTGGERDAFAARALAALRATLDHDRAVVFDEADGLYRGEQSFLDWREQSYPASTAAVVTPIASSKALSTNLLHLRALEVTAGLATDAGATADAARYQGWADALRARIRARLWDDDAGLFATFTGPALDPAPVRRWDLLGSALAVAGGVATPDQARRILASYPHVGPGAAPVIFPQQQLTAIYHNRAEWPFVTAYWLRAAAAADNAAVATRAMRALIRGAALNLSNVENLETVTGAPYVDDGAYSGPVVNSQRQLWSVAGFLSMVEHTLFGVRAERDGLRIDPYLPRALRDGLLAGTDELVLNDLAWRGRRVTIVVHLPPVGGAAGRLAVTGLTVDGVAHDGVIDDDLLAAQSRIDVELGDGDGDAGALTERTAADWRDLYGPRTPSITAVGRDGADVALDLATGGDAAADLTLAIYRDGVRIADDLAGTTTRYLDAGAADDGSPCYAVEACFASGACSQHGAPACWWGDGTAAITTFAAADLVAVGGVLAGDHGRPHVAEWGDAGHTLATPTFVASRTGAHLVQLVYGNGAGGVTTGITAAAKRVVVETEAGAEVGTGVVVMPQLGTWDVWADSTFAEVDLVAGTSYRIRLVADATTVNMSAFEHFASYTGGTGGASGRFERVNVAEIKLLAR
ncbi:MAG: hypothetical protein R2939_17420 [Kofleriaceae bacterium]